MTVIAISNLKGGTGKTTTAVLLATAFTRLGHTVTVIDLDPQGSATEWAHMAADSGEPLPFRVEPGNIHTTKNLRESTDYTLLDCPPGNPGIIDAAVTHADVVLIPVQPSSIEAERMWDTIDIAGADKAVVLLTSVLLNANSTTALTRSIQEEGIRTFTGSIPRREEIRRWYGTAPGNNLHGYADVANQLIKEL